MLYFQQEIEFLFEICRNTAHTVFYQTSFQLSCLCLSWVSQFVFWVYWDDLFLLFWTILEFFGHFKTVLIQQALGSEFIASILIGVMICCPFFLAIFGGFWTLFRTVLIQSFFWSFCKSTVQTISDFYHCGNPIIEIFLFCVECQAIS